MYNLRTALIPMEYDKKAAKDAGKTRRAYSVDISKMDELEVVYAPADSIVIINGTLNKNIQVISMGSSYLFDDMKLNGGSLTIMYAASNIILKGIENINGNKLSTLNLKTRNITICDNDLNNSCLVNLKLEARSIVVADALTFNLEDKKHNKSDAKLHIITPINTSRDMAILEEELNNDIETARTLKLIRASNRNKNN